MRLRDRLHSAMQAFREAPGRRTQLNAAEYQRSLAEQILELRERECEGLYNELRGKDDRLRFLYSRADVLSSVLALKGFSPRLFSTLRRMGFRAILIPEQENQLAGQEQQAVQNEPVAMAM